MHSAPSGPSFTDRLAAALYRALRPAHGRRILVRPRVAGVLLGAVVIGLLVAALPMVSTTPDAPASAALKGSSSAGTGSSQVVGALRTDVVEMGVDGAPAPPPSSSASAPPHAPRAVVPHRATAPGPTSSSVAAPAGSVAASTPTASAVLPQPPVTLAAPPVTVPPVTTSPSASPTTTDASPSRTTSPSPQP